MRYDSRSPKRGNRSEAEEISHPPNCHPERSRGTLRSSFSRGMETTVVEENPDPYPEATIQNAKRNNGCPILVAPFATGWAFRTLKGESNPKTRALGTLKSSHPVIRITANPPPRC